VSVQGQQQQKAGLLSSVVKEPRLAIAARREAHAE